MRYLLYGWEEGKTANSCENILFIGHIVQIPVDIVVSDVRYCMVLKEIKYITSIYK